MKNSMRNIMRKVLVVVTVLLVFWTVLMAKAFLLEIDKDKPDYVGFATLFTAIFVSFILGLYAKAWQKKFEK